MSIGLARPIWKQRTCPACGCVYRGLIPQAKTDEAVGRAVSTGRDLAALLANTNSAAATLPCPGCGTRPQFVVALWRFGLHTAVVVLSLVGAVALAMAAVNRWLTGEAFYIAAGGVAVAGCVLHALVWCWNPNPSLRSQRRRAESAAEDGKLAIVEHPARRPDPIRYPRWTLLAVPSALVSAAAPASAVLLLGVEQPPKIAQTVQVRELVQPGDKGVVASWFAKFQSIGGQYRTPKATVTLKNAAALGLPAEVRCQLHQDSWSGTRIEDVGDSNPQIQIKLDIPDDPKLKGKTLEYRVEATIEYPVRVGRDQFREADAKYEHDFQIRVATDAEVAAVADFNKAGLIVAGINFAGFFAGLMVCMAATGAWNIRDHGTPVGD